jgi:peroxiredoxin
MTVRGQWIVVATIVAVVGVGAAVAAAVFGDQFVPVTVGSQAPDFKAVTLDSVPATRTLADYKGQVTLVNIWATWCGPCEVEMPLLQKLYAEYRDKGVKFVAVSIDSPGMAEAIRQFSARYGLTFDVLQDDEGTIKLNYMATGVPESFILGKDGVIRYKRALPIYEPDAVQIRALLDQLLAEPAG